MGRRWAVMLPCLARPLVRALSFIAIPVLLLGLAGLPSGCKPRPGANDPVNLTWDENADEGMTRLLRVIRTEGIKVLFWNVAWSSLNAGNVIEKNLTELILSNARPHVIVLVEHKPTAVPAADMDFFRQEYPNYAYVPYDASSDVGIAVFSEFPFTQGPTEALDWAPRAASPADQAQYKADWYARVPSEVTHWDRAYTSFQWQIAGHNLNLVPVHLLEPWAAFRTYHGSTETLQNLFLGGDNPLKHQVDHLREKLERDFGSDLSSEPLLLVGDFNVPKMMTSDLPSFPPLIPQLPSVVVPVPIYATLSGDLSEVFDGNPFTFPAFSSPERQRPPFKYSYVKIDHGFVNDGFEPVDARVLPLRGSDHYPIYFSIKPSN